MNNSSYYPGNYTGDDGDGYDDLYDPPLAVVVFLSLCYGSISVAAVVGNGLVIWVILTSRRMRNVTNYYIANLALADIAIGMFAIPFEMMDLDLGGILSGENLEFYKNIQDLKALTVNARALITRSHTMFKDILQGREMNKIVRGTDETEDLDSHKLLKGECFKCGLFHGAHDYCIVQEVIKSGNKVGQSSRKSSTILPHLLDGDDDAHNLEEDKKASFFQLSEERTEVKEWKNLLYREMTPNELESEYTRICYRYGVVNGRKFLLARSLAQEPDKVEPLFTDKNQHIRHRNKYWKGNNYKTVASITRECVPEKTSNLPCPEFGANVHTKMATLLDSVPPCDFKAPVWKKIWKKAVKAEPKGEKVLRETVEDELSWSRSTAAIIRSTSTGCCCCGLEDCDCGVQPICDPPEKKCLTVSGYHNNYLDTIREKMRKRRLLEGKYPPERYHRLLTYSPKEISHDVLRKDSELMMKKAYEIHKKDLKNCVKSAIGEDDVNLDENVSKIARGTSLFTNPDDRTWDDWIERFMTQENIEDDEGISVDSEIPTSCSSGMSSSSSTDHEFRSPQSAFGRIPFAEEPLQLIDYLFDKIYARFRKSIQKSSLSNLIHPDKQFFISHAVQKLMSLKCTDSIGGEVLDMLNLYFRYLKSMKPQKLRRAQKLKRLEAKNKKMLKTIRRRNYIEGIQVGKCYRRPKKYAKFTKDGGYIGFKAEDRKLLQEPTPGRFTKCDLVGDEHGVLLSKKRIHYHYRLLRTLFNGTVQSEDKEGLMDGGMKERLRNFKKTLRNSSQSQVATDSGTEDEDVSMLKTASVPIGRPLKRDEQKLGSAGCFPDRTRSNQNSRTLFSRLNDYGNASSLFEETDPKTSKASLYKSSLKRTTNPNRSSQMETPTRTPLSHEESSKTSNRWDSNYYVPSLSKTSKNSSQRLPSKRFTHPTQSDHAKVPTRTLPSRTSVSKGRSKNTHSLSQWEPFHLPTPPLSESSCDEFNLEMSQHRVPPKEEAHMEKSARMDAKINENQANQSIANPRLRYPKKHKRMDESELTDKSSDSYVPKLLKIPPKRTSSNPVSLRSYKGTAYHQTIDSRAASPYSSDSSSTDTEPTDRPHNIYRERPAWDHKSGLNRKIAPYLDNQIRAHLTNNHLPSGSRRADDKFQKKSFQKSTSISLLPKAGPSILKKTSLPKPPSGETREESKTPGTGVNSVKRQSFSDSSYQMTALPSEGLVRPANVVTERLLKAAQENPGNDLSFGSAKKSSAQSRATPDAVPSSLIIAGASRKTSGAPMAVVSMSGQTVPSSEIGVTSTKKSARAALIGSSTPGQVEAQDDNSAALKHLSVTVKPPEGSLSHNHQGDSSPDDEPSDRGDETKESGKTNSISLSSSKHFIRTSRLSGDAFRGRSLMPSEQIEKKDLRPKHKGEKAIGEKDTFMPETSSSSVLAKLKKSEVIGPTKKRCFNLDIGQGINCINYLKENAPGADEMKKRELVDLMVTPVEVERVQKKATAKAEVESSTESASTVESQLSRQESSSLMNAIQSSKYNTRIHVQSAKDNDSPLMRATNFKTLDQIYKEVHGINKKNTPRQFVDNDYEYEAKKKQQLTKHKIFP